jgi:hypothetical protein
MAQNPAKFVQISVTSTFHRIDQLITHLFALDEDGNVWAYEFTSQGGRKEGWWRLREERS